MKIEIELPDGAENIRVLYEYSDDCGERVFGAKVIEGVRFHCVPAKQFDMLWKRDIKEWENSIRQEIAETLRKLKGE